MLRGKRVKIFTQIAYGQIFTHTRIMWVYQDTQRVRLRPVKMNRVEQLLISHPPYS